MVMFVLQVWFLNGSSVPAWEKAEASIGPYEITMGLNELQLSGLWLR